MSINPINTLSQKVHCIQRSLNSIEDFVSMIKDNPDLADNKSFVMAGVLLDGGALEYASAQLQDDKSVVLQAVMNKTNTYEIYSGSALSHASKRLRDDWDVVFASIQNNPSSIGDASQRLRCQDLFVNKVSKKTTDKPSALSFDVKVPDEVQKKRVQFEPDLSVILKEGAKYYYKIMQ